MIEMRRRTLLAAAGGLVLPGVARASGPAAKVGEPAPPFSVFTFDWKKIYFKEMRGKVVLLNYWATWCPPCRVELPILSAYYKQHTDKGLLIYAVKGDDANGESRPNAELLPMAKTVSFPLVWRLTGDGYGPLGGFPSNYVIGRDGVVRYAEAGAFEADSLDAVVGPLLTASAPVSAA
jgi:cytochrome c biogenesis protein CcmG, thiol:disulfide interchange protein DsbE